MANRKNWLGVLVIVLVFGMMVVGCGDGSGSGTDPALNGTWVIEGEQGYKFNNGKFEVFSSDAGKAMGKGTYTTSDNKITMTITHFSSIYLGLGEETNSFDSSKWYTKADLKALGVPDDNLDIMFAPYTSTYSISGNTLTITDIDEEEGDTHTQTYTKK